METKKIYEKLAKVQAELKAPKGQFNSFGKYHYRSQEDILEAVKPILSRQGMTINLTDDIVLVGERYYVKSTATVSDGTDTISVTAFAREPSEKKGMDESQITGTASSYARKYALNGLFAIDDTKDSDTEEQPKPTIEKREATPSPKQPTNKLDEALIKEASSLKIDLNKVATYLKKNVQDLTNEDLKTCIERKKKSLAGGNAK